VGRLPFNQRPPSERSAIFSDCSCSQEGHSERITETQCAWWCPEVQQAVIWCGHAQEDLQALPADDDKAESFQLASIEAQETIEDAKARLWHEFVTDSRGELSSAEIF